MNITKYIIQLLYNYERVIIPGFGAFIAKYQPAFVNNDNQIIYPPRRKVNFNPEIIKDDGLLSAVIAEKEKIENSGAQDILKEYVKALNIKFEKEGKIIFEKIGVIKKDKDKIVFKPDFKSNFLFDVFGMTEIKIEPEKEIQKTLQTEIKKPIPKPVTELHDGRKTLRRVLVYSFILALLVFVFIFIDFEFAEEQPVKNIPVSPPKKENYQKVVEKRIEEKTEQKTALFYQEPKESKTTYYIIAGSFKNPDNAEKLIDNLKEKGYTPELLELKQGTYRVSISSFENKSQALNKLSELRSILNQSLWILGQ